MSAHDDTDTGSKKGFAQRVPTYSRFLIGIPVLGLLAGAVTLTGSPPSRRLA